MALQLRRVIGFNGGLRGACVAHPAAPDCMVTVAGGAVVVSPEDPWALDAQRVLRGHEDRITAFAMSHSGTAMASGSCGRKADVVLWDFASGAVRSCFQEHDMEVVVLAFSPDDRLLLTVGHEKDQKLFVLDAATGKIVTKQPLPYVPGKRVTCAAWGVTQGVAYSFAVGTSDGDVLLYSLQPVQGMAGCVKVTSGSLRRSFTCLTYSADGQWLYAGTSTGDVVTINVLRRSMQMSHPACSGGVGAMVLTPSGRLLVGGGDGALTLLTNDHMWRDIRPFAAVPGPVTSLSMTPDGAALLVGTSNGGAHRLPIGATEAAALVRGHAGCVRGVDTAGGTAATCSDDGTVVVWALPGAAAAAGALPPYAPTQVCRAERKEAGAPLCVALAPAHGGLMLSGWEDGVVRAHVLGGPVAPAWVIPGAHVQPSATGVTALAVAARSPLLLTGGAGGEVRLWDLRSRVMASHMKQHGGAVTGLAMLSDDVHAVASSADRSWSLWDVLQGTCRASWRTPSKLNGIAVLPDQLSVVLGCQDGSAAFFDIRSPQLVRALPKAHAGEVTAVATDATGRLLATGGTDGGVRLWDVASGRAVAAGTCHTAPVAKVAFTAEGWDAQSPAPRQVALVSVSLDGTVAAWHMPWPL